MMVWEWLFSGLAAHFLLVGTMAGLGMHDFFLLGNADVCDDCNGLVMKLCSDKWMVYQM